MTKTANTVLAILTSAGPQDRGSLEYKCHAAGVDANAFGDALIELAELKAIRTAYRSVRSGPRRHDVCVVSVA